MYVPAHFAMTDEQIEHVLRHLGQADLVTQHADGLAATPLPLLYDPDRGPRGSLLGHVARNNRQWSEPVTGPALVLAHLTDHYVSPAWLPSAAGGHVVPTWDYVTVHVHGELIVHDDPEWTRAMVVALTEHQEARRPGPQPRWSTGDVDGDYLERMLRAIVGLEVRISRVEGKAKMAQNKTPADVAALAETLAQQGDHDGAQFLQTVSLPAAQRRAATLAEVAERHSR